METKSEKIKQKSTKKENFEQKILCNDDKIDYAPKAQKYRIKRAFYANAMDITQRNCYDKTSNLNTVMLQSFVSLLS